jgi:hypothetical protein
MKITLMNGTQIDCTVDEYEELMARGLLGNKQENLQEGLKELINWPKEDYTPKSPYQPGVVALYGCEVPQFTSDLINSDLSAVSLATENTMTMDGIGGRMYILDQVKALLSDKTIDYRIIAMPGENYEIHIEREKNGAKLVIMFIKQSEYPYDVRLSSYKSLKDLNPFSTDLIPVGTESQLSYLKNKLLEYIEEL